MNLPLESRIQRLNEMMSEGRIIRKGWFGIDEQGRATACLLAALSPEAGDAENPDFCPAAVMPLWFAHLTPWIDDACSETEWPRVIRRYAACAARWSALDDAAWRRVEVVARRASVVEAMSYTSDEQVLAACRGVLDWLDADMPEASQAAVEAAAVAAATAAVAAATAAVVAATVVAATAAVATAAVATAAVAGARRQRRAAAWAASRAEVADRIVDTTLAALEKECGL